MGITREKLHAEVWAEPMTTVAARYGVSSSFLARVCERLNVPRPPRGYWAQLEFGKAGDKPALPEARPGDPLEWSRDGEPVRAPAPLPPAPVAGAASPRRRPRAQSSHEVLDGARAHFEAAKESDGGYLRPLKKRLVDLFVSRGTLDRALDVANAFFLASSIAGIGSRWRPWTST